MARPMNKSQLVEFSENEFHRLTTLIDTLTPKQRDSEYVFDNRTPKDIVAHLYAWQLMELSWYSDGEKGLKPQIPAPGYTFKDSPALNEKLFQDYKDISWDKLIKLLMDSHNKLLSIIKSHTNEELFTKKKYVWTGSSDMAVYLRSALSSHYVWAIDLIRKYFKKQAK
jgi:hypothetical protein